MTPFESQQNNATWLLKSYRRLKNEPIDWHIEPDEIDTFLDEIDFACDVIIEDKKAHLEYLSRPSAQPLHKGEFMVAARSRI